jgi:hypothetical protein
MKLWKRFSGEPFLINPTLAIVNRRRGRKKVMATPRDSKGRFRKRRHHHNAPGPGRRDGRRRHHARAHNPPARRRHRRNPGGVERGINLLGVTLPSMRATAGVTAGFIAPPFFEGFLKGAVPAGWMTDASGRPSQAMNYVVKVGSVLGLSLAVRQFFGREDAKRFVIGGTTYLAVNIYNDFLAPMLFPRTVAPAVTGAGFYNPGRLGSQPLLGRYPGMRGSVTDNVPERLRPQSRF